ncbi:MAG: AAA family ATPase [archaeon]
MKESKIVVIRGYLAAGKSTTFENLKASQKMNEWLFLDFAAIRKMFNNNKNTQIEFADRTFYASLRELVKTGKNILTQETSEDTIMKKIGPVIKKNKYRIIVIALTVSPETSYKRATARSKIKGKKPRTKKEVFDNYKARKLKLDKEGILMDTEKLTRKQVIDGIIKIIC